MINDHVPLIIFIGALLIDLLLGEFPNKLHPVVWMGNYIKLIWSGRFSRTKGFLFV